MISYDKLWQTTKKVSRNTHLSKSTIAFGNGMKGFAPFTPVLSKFLACISGFFVYNAQSGHSPSKTVLQTDKTWLKMGTQVRAP